MRERKGEKEKKKRRKEGKGKRMEEEFRKEESKWKVWRIIND